MADTCPDCGCELACPICDDANKGLTDTIDQLQQQRDNLGMMLRRALRQVIQARAAMNRNDPVDPIKDPFMTQATILLRKYGFLNPLREDDDARP